jgi:hypothetical protein
MCYKLVKIVSQKFSTLIPSMAIIDPKERTLWPVIDLSFLALWLHYVQYNRNSVFVIISKSISFQTSLPYNSLIRICTIGGYNAISLRGVFRWLKTSQHKVFMVERVKYSLEALQESSGPKGHAFLLVERAKINRHRTRPLLP